MSTYRARRVGAGLHEYRGRLLVRTTWDGPRGGIVERWELAEYDRWGNVVIDGVDTYRTMRDAKVAVDHETLAAHA